MSKSIIPPNRNVEADIIRSQQFASAFQQILRGNSQRYREFKDSLIYTLKLWIRSPVTACLEFILMEAN